MSVSKITVTAVNGLDPGERVWDTIVQGFGVRRQTNGAYYYLRYRLNGTQHMRSIGRHGSPWTPDTARNEAKRLLGTLVGGADPFAQPLAAEGFGAEIERYLGRKRAVLKPRSFDEVERYLRKHAEPLHNLRLSEIDRRTIAVLLAEIEQSSGSVCRNRARSAISAFFTWAITEGLLDANPVTGTAKADEGGSRERVLMSEELRKLWLVLAEVNNGFADLVRLLLLTGQRRNEIGKLRWDEIDLERGMIVLGPERTKNRRQHELPLSRQARAILERQPRRNSIPFLFSQIEGFKNWDKAKARLDRRLRIAPWRLHDLRRTCATQMMELGTAPHVCEAILNHVSGSRAGVAGIYNRSKLIEPMRDALQRWGDHVDKLTK